MFLSHSGLLARSAEQRHLQGEGSMGRGYTYSLGNEITSGSRAESGLQSQSLEGGHLACLQYAALCQAQTPLTIQVLVQPRNLGSLKLCYLLVWFFA